MTPVGVSLLEVGSGSHAALHRSVEWVTFNALTRSLGFWFPTRGGGGTPCRAGWETLSQQHANSYDSQTGENNQTLGSQETHDISRK